MLQWKSKKNLYMYPFMLLALKNSFVALFPVPSVNTPG